MSNFLFYSDLHIRPERLEDCETVLNGIFKIAKEIKKDLKDLIIVNGGDTFNTRGTIRTSCFDTLYRHYRKWADAGLEQIILVGNHDQEDKAGEVHPLRVFNGFADGWHVVDKPEIIKDVGFLPYMQMDEIQPALEEMQSYKIKDLVVHWGIRGAKRNDSNTDSDGVPIGWLKPFRHVFSGHYHYRNDVANVHYIGSPLQQNFGEMGQDKGVLFYDQKGEPVFLEIKGTPKHYEGEVTWNGNRMVETIPAIKSNDFLRVKVKGDAERCRMYQPRLDLCKSVSVQREVEDKTFSRLNIEAKEISNIDQLMNKYVDFVNTGLDKKKIIEFGMRIING